MNTFLESDGDTLDTAVPICKALVDYPERWGDLSDPANLIDNTQYWEWLEVKDRFTESFTTISLVSIDELVTWDIYKPKTRDMMRYNELVSENEIEDAVLVLVPFLKAYPDEWGDLKTVASIREQLPWWASRLLGRSLNNAIVAHQKK